MGGINFPGVRGNATVPSNAPIQPSQAFVDNIGSILIMANAGTAFDLSNKGITSFVVGQDVSTSPILCAFSIASQLAGAPNINLSGNAIANTNAILADLVPFAGGVSGGTINLSGGTNAAPTGQGITDKAALILAGWTVNTN